MTGVPTEQLARRLKVLSGLASSLRYVAVVCLLVFARPGGLAGQTQVVVPAGADLQAAIDRARPGDVLVLTAGASYVGNFTLPATAGASYITITSDANPAHFPSGQRVTPDLAQWMPVLRSPNTSPALSTAPGAHHWRLRWLMFKANRDGVGDIITLGDGSTAQRDLSNIPHHFIIDGLVIQGDPTRGQKRGIALNSGAAIIRNSDIRDIKAPGQDSQAICGWNGPGPYLIENNYLEAAGENVMFGGADPAVPGLVPSDITVRRNYFTKRLTWRDERSPWTVKNLLELKSARRVLIEWNLFEHSWAAAQTGYAILFTPLNQDGAAPWTVVSDVTFQFNILRHAASAFNMLGYDYHAPSLQTRRVTIRDNLFYDIDAAKWGGDGRFLLIGDEPADLVVDHNTILQSGTFLLFYGQRNGQPRRISNMRVTNNLTLHNEYGIFGEDYGLGRVAIEAYLTSPDIRANVLSGGDASRYPAGNFFPAVQAFVDEFVDAGSNDYRLRPSSRFRNAGTHRSMLGANVEALRRGVPRGE
ncbi:MAG: hypothetical protein ABIS06_21315 [Vicinamibacterales bacterium]